MNVSYLPSFDIIVAMDENQGIGHTNNLPWKLSEDLKHFKNLTSRVKDPKKRNAVIMGRKTWDSLPESFRPLPDRFNIVISRHTHSHHPQTKTFKSLDAALQFLAKQEEIETIFVIGGGQIYQEAIKHSSFHKLWLTEILGSFVCDTFFPAFRNYVEEISRSETHQEKNISFQFVCFQNKLSKPS